MNKNRTPLIMALLILLGLTAINLSRAEAALPSYDRVRVLQSAKNISDTELINQDGQPFRLSQLHGRVALVFFGFTNCPDVCPMAMQSLRELEAFGGDGLADIDYVLISVDGERDTPEVMKAFLERYSPHFIGLTGEHNDVKALAKEFSAAFFKESANAHGEYSVSHSPQVFVIDKSGRLRAEFYNASVEAMHAVAIALLNEPDDGVKREPDGSNWDCRSRTRCDIPGQDHCCPTSKKKMLARL